jgi:hypothetical protein
MIRSATSVLIVLAVAGCGSPEGSLPREGQFETVVDATIARMRNDGGAILTLGTQAACTGSELPVSVVEVVDVRYAKRYANLEIPVLSDGFRILATNPKDTEEAYYIRRVAADARLGEVNCPGVDVVEGSLFLLHTGGWARVPEVMSQDQFIAEVDIGTGIDIDSVPFIELFQGPGL